MRSMDCSMWSEAGQPCLLERERVVPPYPVCANSCCCDVTGIEIGCDVLVAVIARAGLVNHSWESLRLSIHCCWRRDCQQLMICQPRMS